MNLNKYKWMAVLPVVFTACQQEALVEELPMDSALSTITCTIGGDQADSRAQIVLGNKNREQEIFHWNAGDKFTLFQTWGEMTQEDGYVNEYYSYNYHIDGSYSDTAPANTAQFSLDEGSISNVEYEWNWIAFYPMREAYSKDTTDDYCKLEISNTMTDNSESSWKEYFRKNMYMMSYGSAADDFSKGVSFEHLCGIVRITYTNATNTDHELNGIYVDGTLGKMQEYEIHQPLLLSDWASSNMHGITFTEKATVPAGESADFYILYFRPQAGQDGEIQNMKGIKVDYDVNGTSSMSQTPSQYFGQEFSYNGFQPGLCSWFKITGLDDNRIVWTRDYNPKDDEGQGEQPGGGESSGTETTVSEYSSLISALSNDKFSKIKFSGDIVLEAPLKIERNVQFDLQGHNLKLSSDFETLSDVIEIKTNGVSFYLDNAIVDLTNHTSKMNSFIRTSGVGVKLYMGGTTITLGNNFGPAIWMGDAQLTVGGSNITANTAISYRCTQNSTTEYESNVDANINGNVSFSSATGALNTVFYFTKGTINGSLNIEGGVNDDVYIADYIKYSKDKVTFGNNALGWDKAGEF